MGNFHCISSKCAKVVYREYLPPVVRWRYEDEDWQEIEGDDYSVEQEKGQCLNGEYQFKGNFILKNQSYAGYQCGNSGIFTTNVSIGGIINSFSIVDNKVQVVQEDLLGNATIYNFPVYWEENLAKAIVPSDNCISSFSTVYGNNFNNVQIVKVDEGLDNCGDCVFTITKDGKQVYLETRDKCPEEVIKLPCRISEKYQEISINKDAWTQKVQVVGNNFNSDILENIDDFINGDIPDNCREIWKTPSLDLPNVLIPNGEPTLFFNDYERAGQICSAPGCPPPEYNVICDCEEDCESCPEGTCEVDCGEHICCVDPNTGNGIKTIQKDNYCGD